MGRAERQKKLREQASQRPAPEPELTPLQEARLSLEWMREREQSATRAVAAGTSRRQREKDRLLQARRDEAALRVEMERRAAERAQAARQRVEEQRVAEAARVARLQGWTLGGR